MPNQDDVTAFTAFADTSRRSFLRKAALAALAAPVADGLSQRHGQ